jgi:predicted Zn-dependent protease
LILNQFTSTTGTVNIVAADFNPRKNICNSMIISRINKYVVTLFVIVISAGIAFFFLRKAQTNPVTGKKQHISSTVREEIELGLQCAPDMAAKFGGLYADTEIQNRIKNIGQKVAGISQVSKSPFQFDFHILADLQTINAFSFPGGQIFITKGLLDMLKSDHEVAAILSHEIGHVIGRHAGEKLSRFNFLQGIKEDTTHTSEYSSDAVNEYITDLSDMNFNITEEEEADHFGVVYMKASGYNPAVFLEVLTKLEQQSESRRIEYIQKHQVSANRLENIRAQVKR